MKKLNYDIENVHFIPKSNNECLAMLIVKSNNKCVFQSGIRIEILPEELDDWYDDYPDDCESYTKEEIENCALGMFESIFSDCKTINDFKKLSKSYQ